MPTATAFLDGESPLFDDGTRVFDIEGRVGIVVKTQSFDGVWVATLRDELSGETWEIPQNDLMRAF